MATRDLTAQRLRELLHYDSDTGIFTWRVDRAGRRGAKAGSIAGSLHESGYIRIGIDYTIHLAHRLAWLYVHGTHPIALIDHINTNKADNRLCNLRQASAEINQQNKLRPRAGTTSRFLGVWWNKQHQKWESHITANHVRRFVGRFDSEEDAYAAYLVAKRKFQPGCTV